MRLEFEMKQPVNSDQINKSPSSQGATIYQIPLKAFPGFWAFGYFVQFEYYQVLIDTGSGYGDSNKHLSSGFQAISEISEMKTRLEDLTHIFITHGHIDHFGALPYVMKMSEGITFENIGMELGPFQFHHVTSHCPGQVAIKFHNELFSGDHILSEISPHQAPERLVLNTGLRHYL